MINNLSWQTLGLALRNSRQGSEGKLPVPQKRRSQQEDEHVVCVENILGLKYIRLAVITIRQLLGRNKNGLFGPNNKSLL